MMNPKVICRTSVFVACMCNFIGPSTGFATANGRLLPSSRSITRVPSHTTTSCAATNDDGNNNEKGTSSNAKEGRGTINPLRLAVLKLGLTELRYTSPLNYEKRPGNYDCANCGSTLFDSNGKYDSGSGWPSFWKTKDANRVGYKREWDGRIEVNCKNCGGHLGHAFPDGPQRKDIPDELLETIPSDDLETSDPSNVYTRLPRYCVNGASLKFKEQ